MSVSFLSVGVFVAIAAMISLLLFGVPFWMAFLGYCVAGASATFVTAWVYWTSTQAEDA